MKRAKVILRQLQLASKNSEISSLPTDNAVTPRDQFKLIQSEAQRSYKDQVNNRIIQKLVAACTQNYCRYGHSVPKTVRGKMFCMIYAAIGVPLNLTMFQAIGERMNAMLGYCLRKFKKCLGMKTSDVSIVQLVAVGLIAWTVTLCAGAALFSEYEGWGYIDSLYYFFITLTTIGFGDYVALQEVNHQRTKDRKSMYISLTMVMIYVGLTIASSVINLLVMRLMELQQPKKKRHKLSVQSGPRCSHCQHGADAKIEEDGAGVLANQSVIILKNFEEELSFTSYKQVHQKRASI